MLEHGNHKALLQGLGDSAQQLEQMVPIATNAQYR